MKPISGLNVDELLGRKKKAKIFRENAIPDFRQMLDNAEDPNAIQDAADQLSSIIEAQIKDSFGDSGYGPALEELRVLREELIEMEEPGIYNDFMIGLKQRLLAEELGGDRKEMWWEIRKTRLGLIEKKTSPQSDITEEEARHVSIAPLDTCCRWLICTQFFSSK